ncbi:hypothetical protein FRB90_003303 [Tulasnella sp. 427]|nr:hypothetical protein FRB90_003303 [Tulasnella sp. 427]
MSLQDNRQKRAIILLALGDYVEKAHLRYGGQSQKAADASKLAGAASRLVILLDQSDGPRKQSNSPSPTSASSPTKGGSTKRNAGGMKASQDREAGKSQRKSAKSVKAQQVDEEDEDEDETEDEGGKDEDAEQVDSPRVALRSSTRQRALIKSQKTTPEPTIAKDQRERHAKRSPSPSSSSSDDIQEDDAPFFVEASASGVPKHQFAVEGPGQGSRSGHH